MNESDQQRIRNAVESRMRSFEAAERALDTDRLIAHFALVPEFLVYNDGQRLNHAAITANLQSGFPTLRSIEGGFENIHVFVLAPDAALAAAEFSEVITDRTGTVTRVRGAASWLWRVINGEWKIVYGHADHYPDEMRD
jgi:ketosteroid isomerase-like protein